MLRHGLVGLLAEGPGKFCFVEFDAGSGEFARGLFKCRSLGDQLVFRFLSICVGLENGKLLQVGKLAVIEIDLLVEGSQEVFVARGGGSLHWGTPLWDEKGRSWKTAPFDQL